MSEGPLIQVTDLRREYRVGEVSVPALGGVSLEIGHGEFVAVMGPSGSGKSTFMNLLGGLDRPSAGRYRLDGEDVTGLSADALAAVRNRTLGFVFQSFNLLPRASALENVALPLVYAGVKVAERQRRALAQLERVGLADRAHHRPSQLSGGQQQRVAIARALVNDPRLILADEPTGALDTLTSLELMALLQELNDNGITLVIVTHEHDIAAFARRVLSFRDGRVVEDRAVGAPARAADLIRDQGQCARGEETPSDPETLHLAP
ncbi:MAG TPA: ABC transporter ATP-binding protein [Thiobacillaceae bacterium]|nr:ABC transporter ATP-binding protein [Thiobacillaceae bacterium]